MTAQSNRPSRVIPAVRRLRQEDQDVYIVRPCFNLKKKKEKETPTKTKY
jgi:hypothetical protein